ncbi:CUB domain,Low-density lipoprotein (LDL) receptor class A repeat,Low-density lipoprotein (LDL) [Cinara cedri]|uniref:CUB domain,Low-density lipoprotein (LDL) receptor class A repeat,Low-density lipoprotein (LDL) n=1 Tax=Cinara cedri TaxID=506608 RepID=A0A5E4MZ01_9HEMI|nr:CUB domain,Low-density lipoprotein (LDL) receptor class A repeat,Low-density lipoprotein (LDL) [Cinara cedri]
MRPPDRGPGPPATAATLLALLAFLLLRTDGGLAEKSKFFEMQGICKSHFLQQVYRKIDGAVVDSHNERNLNCVTTFQTHTVLQRFMIHFDRLQLDCNDHLFIFDGAHAVGAHKADITCSSTKQSIGVIFTRTNFVTLKYVTDSWGTRINGFRLIITAFKDPFHNCREFKCQTMSHCISSDLVCDTINHCPDGTDEESTPTCQGPSSFTLMGINTTILAVASLIVVSILGVCVIVLTVYCICYRTSNGTIPNSRHSASLHDTSNNFQMIGVNGIGRSGNWQHPAGQQLGYSSARVRLYCQAK